MRTNPSIFRQESILSFSSWAAKGKKKVSQQKSRTDDI